MVFVILLLTDLGINSNEWVFEDKMREWMNEELV